MSDEAPVISCRNVWKLFGADPHAFLKKITPDMSYEDIRQQGYIAGVKDVSIDVHKGEMLVVMGLSGSGKSTLVRCFSRLHDITGGTIEVEGQDVMALPEKELIELRRSKMGMVFQSFGLLPHRTVLENVAFPLIRKEMQDEFLRLQQLLNKTIVFITHDFDEALRLADRIAIMKDGAVEQCDTPDQIVLHPATEYVRKFTEEIDKARVVHASVLADPKAKGKGDPVDAGTTVQGMAQLLVNDSRKLIPVEKDGVSVGAMNRQAALDILLGVE